MENKYIMEYRTFTAKTKEAAITAASIEFGVTSDHLDYIVDTEGSNGFFGIGSRDAVIRARVREEAPEETDAGVKEENRIPEEKKEEDLSGKPRIKTLDEIEARAKAAAEAAEKAGITYADKPEREERREGRNRRNRRGRGNDRKNKNDRFERAEEKEETVEYHAPSVPKPEKEVPVRTEEEIEQMKKDAETFLRDVFRSMEMEVDQKITYDPENGCLNCEFAGEEMGILIGKRGQTLDSLQYLTSLVVNKNQGEYVRVKLDTEEYRKRRKETLESLSRNIAGKVKRTRRSVVLEPMNPYERRIIHSALQGNRFVETYSEGEEPFRRVVVAPKKNY